MEPEGKAPDTRLYLGNLPRNATKADVENHFNTHGTGEITEIKLMNGFGFIEYKDAMDARDVVPAFHGSEFMGERLVVQFARGSTRPRDGPGYGQERMAPRPRRTVHRMTITGLPFETSWQDLKDFARQSGLDVVYSEVNRERDTTGTGGKGFVEYETAADLEAAVEKLHQHDFKGVPVNCISDPQSEIPRPREPRYRSRSPGYRGRGYGGHGGHGGPPMDDYYDRRGPPRGYSPRRDDYRRRSPPPRYYDDPRDDRYGAPPGPPPRGGGAGYEPDPYVNGHGREPYGRPPSPRGGDRRGGGGYDRGYDARPSYW